MAALASASCGGNEFTGDAPDASSGAAGNPSTGTGGAPDAGLPPCGGLLGRKCATDSYCDYKPGDCGLPDAAGVCRPRPMFCPLVCTSACGCDGNFYCNVCVAHSAGVDDSKYVTFPDGGIGP